MDTPTYFIYVLLSTIADKHYVGMSNDPVARLKQHNAGHSQFTKGYRLSTGINTLQIGYLLPLDFI